MLWDEFAPFIYWEGPILTHPRSQCHNSRLGSILYIAFMKLRAELLTTQQTCLQSNNGNRQIPNAVKNSKRKVLTENAANTNNMHVFMFPLAHVHVYTMYTFSDV